MRKIGILWDDSHIWGLMALRAIAALGFAPRLLKAGYIARNGLHGNGLSMLVVPGGRARAKAMALGNAGLDNIRSFVAGGGMYLGFCGGAGLALTPKAGESGLALCPWQRGVYPKRLLHLISGDLLSSVHLPAHTDAGGSVLAPLPVWWPGKFAPVPGAPVRTLAQSLDVGEDFWLADIRAAHVPPRVRAAWREDQGLGLDYLVGQPLVIEGEYGKGRYILSYSHLETPRSEFANAWLAAILGDACERDAKISLVPAWTPAPGKSCLRGDIAVMMEQILARMEKLLRLGSDLRLFFQRSSWLFGWRAGFAGLGCNSLRLGLAHLAQRGSTNAANVFWTAQQENFSHAAEEFFERAEAALWNLRLERTLAAKPGSLAGDASDIFGHPMLGGGLVSQLLDVVYELIYLNEADETDARRAPASSDSRKFCQPARKYSRIIQPGLEWGRKRRA